MMRYPTTEATKRPYRLGDANAKATMRWRYYSDPKRAHLGALIECRWSKVSTTIEVYNALNGKLLGQYTRKLDAIAFLGARHGEEERLDPRAASQVSGYDGGEEGNHQHTAGRHP